MTLKEWAIKWPYALRYSADGNRVNTPDSIADEVHRARAFRLQDFRVTSLSGGSLWFARKTWMVRGTLEGHKAYGVSVTLGSEAEALRLVADWHSKFEGYVMFDHENGIFDIVFKVAA